MKSLLYFLFLLMTVSSYVHAKNVDSFTLTNGLKVIHFYKPDVSVASFQVWYKVGSFVEKTGEKGLSHLFEHMMFRGSKSLEMKEHSRLIQSNGGTSNAYTKNDITVYHQVIPSDKIELIF